MSSILFGERLWNPLRKALSEHYEQTVAQDEANRQYVRSLCQQHGVDDAAGRAAVTAAHGKPGAVLTSGHDGDSVFGERGMLTRGVSRDLWCVTPKRVSADGRATDPLSQSYAKVRRPDYGANPRQPQPLGHIPVELVVVTNERCVYSPAGRYDSYENARATVVAPASFETGGAQIVAVNYIGLQEDVTLLGSMKRAIVKLAHDACARDA